METIITKVPAIANYLGNRLLDSPVEVLATELSKGAFKWIKSLFFDKKNNPNDIVLDLRNDPNDKDNREAVRIQLTKALKKDPSAEQWLQEIYSLLQKKAESGDVDAINTLNSDNSRIETTIIADGDVNIGDNTIAHIYHSYQYKELQAKLEKLNHDFEVHKQLIYTYPDNEHFRNKLQEIDAERGEVQKQIEDLKSVVRVLAETFSKISINNERINIAREYFEKGDYEASRTILNSMEIGRELEQLLQYKEQLHEKIYENEFKLLQEKADEYLILAQLTALDFSDPSRFEQTKYYYEQSIRAHATPLNLFAFGKFLQEESQYIDAELIYLKVLEFIRQLGNKYSQEYELERARTLGNLANIHRIQNKFAEAEKEYDECLVIFRKLAVVNPLVYEPYIARTLNNLANLHQNQNKYAEAEKEYDECLAIYRKLAHLNPQVYEQYIASTLNNLASLHSDQNKYAEAEKEYDECLAIRRRLALLNSQVYEPYIASTLNNLAILHRNQNKYAEAEKEYEESLGIFRKLAHLNPQVYEPDIASTLNNLAILHYAQNKYTEAEKEYEECLAIRRKLAHLNPQVYEPDIASTLNNLAILHSDQNKYAEAEKEYEECLAIRRKLAVVNPLVYEPYIARTLNNLAILHYAQNKYTEAEKEYEECLAIRRKLAHLNPQVYEPDIASTLNNLAILHSDQNKYEEAEKEYEESLAIYRKLAHLNPQVYEQYIASTLNNLANLHSNQNKYAEAEKEYEECLAIRRKLAHLNPQVYEPDTASTLNNIANLHKNQNKYEEAEKEFEESLAIYRKLAILNPQVYEPYIARTLNNLATLHREQNKHGKAEREYQEALAIRKKLAETNPLIHESELARTLINVASLHYAQNRFEEADEEYTRASVIHLNAELKRVGNIEVGYIEIHGYKSIKSAKISLRPINILIGANGAGKSNFLSFFELLESLYQNRLTEYTATHGGMEIIPHKGEKFTHELAFTVGSEGNNWYKAVLKTGSEGFLFQSEEFNIGNHRFALSNRFTTESMLSKVDSRGRTFLESTFKNFRKFHFQDTGEQTPFKHSSHIENDIYYLYKDGRNIAAFLYNLKENYNEFYRDIVSTIQSIAPFFSDFFLQPNEGNLVRLQWRDKYSDVTYGPTDLSDGTLRFIALTTLFLQPNLPDTIIIDEPELGLHPFALAKLAGMIQSVSQIGTQVIMATHSTDLLNHFKPEDIITVDQRNGESTFNRLKESDLSVWLEKYAIGDLWQRNIIQGGQPV